MNGYVFFYARQRVEIHAETLYAAKQEAIRRLNPPRSKQHMVHGALAELDGKQVTHTPDF